MTLRILKNTDPSDPIVVPPDVEFDPNWLSPHQANAVAFVRNETNYWESLLIMVCGCVATAVISATRKPSIKFTDNFLSATSLIGSLGFFLTAALGALPIMEFIQGHMDVEIQGIEFSHNWITLTCVFTLRMALEYFVIMTNMMSVDVLRSLDLLLILIFSATTAGSSVTLIATVLLFPTMVKVAHNTIVGKVLIGFAAPVIAILTVLLCRELDAFANEDFILSKSIFSAITIGWSMGVFCAMQNESSAYKVDRGHRIAKVAILISFTVISISATNDWMAAYSEGYEPAGHHEH